MRDPRVWLVVQVAGVVLLASAAGLLHVEQAHDTASYFEAARSTPTEMLSGIRTAGYPLFLKSVALLSPDYRVVPWVQLGAHLLAVALFEIALRRFGATPWQAVAAASGLLYTVLNDPAVAMLLTDSLGRTMAIATVAFLLWSSSDRGGGLPWIGLAAALFAAYQVRPAYLFLLPLVPCLGLVLLRIRTGWAGRPFRWLRHAVLLVGVSAIPYLAFCLLRLVLVGHFGLVSFAGANLIGITVELLDEKTIEHRLPETWRPLAREVLAERRRVGQESPFKDRGIDMIQWQRNYPVNCWDVGYAAAARMVGDDPVAINEQLSGLSKALIKAKTAAYLRFLVYNLRDGVSRVLGRGWVLQMVALLALAAFFVRVMRFPARDCGEIHPSNFGNPGVMHALVIIALAFAAAKLLLVGLVEVNVPRYIFAARVFLPAVFSLVLCQEVLRIAHEHRSASGGTLR